MWFYLYFSELGEEQLKISSRIKMLLSLKKLFNWFTRPKSKNEDFARREFILNVLLLGAIFLSTLATFLAKLSLSQVLQKGETDQGIPIEISTAISLVFLALYFFSRAGKSRWVAYIFIWLCFIPTAYTSYNWGADVPQALLTYGLIIVMAGILISTKFALAMTVFSSVTLFIFSYLQIKGIIAANLLWKSKLIHLRDAGVYVATLTIVALVSWLSNREIEKALHRARSSEKALKKERDLLELKVEKRTKELRQAQLEKMTQLYRFAEFGRLTSGFFHDLVNPLTDVSLNLEKLSAQETSSLLKRALSGTKRMESFVNIARKQIQKQEIKTAFSVADEIEQAIQLLTHKAKEGGVGIRFPKTDNIEIHGNPLKFYQLISNLLSNGIDSYEKIKRGKKKRQVLIEAEEADGMIRLVVQDWGCGIPQKHLGKIFDPFFTTKSVDKGTGIGLCICKDIVEKDFNGHIHVESKQSKNRGTTFTAEFPIKQDVH